MIEEAAIARSRKALSSLYELFTVGRPWYYEKRRSEERATEDIDELRDVIEQIVF